MFSSRTTLANLNPKMTAGVALEKQRAGKDAQDTFSKRTPFHNIVLRFGAEVLVFSVDLSKEV